MVTLTFTVNTTPPATPELTSPVSGAKASTETAFTWTDVGNTSQNQPVTYTIQIASDQNFNSLVLEKRSITSAQYTLTPEEKLKSVPQKTPYFWRVKSVDAAASESAWSAVRSFYTSSTFTLPPVVIWIVAGVVFLAIVGLAFWLGRRTAWS